jgi:hypothetical protein
MDAFSVTPRKGTRGETVVDSLNRFTRITVRCEKTEFSYSPMISLACELVPVKTSYSDLIGGSPLNDAF